MPAMSFSSSPDISPSKPTTIQEDGQFSLHWYTASVSPVRSVSSTALNQVHPVTATQRSAPQFIQTSSSLRLETSSLSGQPHMTILLPTLSPSRPPESSGSVNPTPVLVSVTSISTASPASSNQYVSSYTPLSLMSISITPQTISVLTAVSISASSSAAAAVISVTPTATTSSESAAPSSSAASEESMVEQGHHAPFYIAIVVGSILAIGLIAAVIAWAVRVRMHARRRREDQFDVPWKNRRDDHDMLEAARDATFYGKEIHRIGSADKSSQDFVLGWEPCGDRDVGEPKRSDSYVRSSVHSSLTAYHNPYTNYQSNPAPSDRIAYPAPLYHGHERNTYPDPSQFVDGRQSASSLGRLTVVNVTPADTSPASSCTSTPKTMYTARTGGTEEYETRASFPSIRHSAEDVENSWEPLPLPGQAQDSSDLIKGDTHWTSSLRSNFTHAFNAVAASLPSGAALMINNQDSRSSRPSLASVFSRSDSTISKSWTLEERGDGTGRVLFHDLPPGSDPTPSRSTSFQTLSTRSQHLGSAYGGLPRQPSIRRSPSSSSSCSVYSTSSAPRLPALSRHSTIKMDPMATVYEKEEEAPVTQKPTLVTRSSSSSGCSVTAYYYGVDTKHIDSRRRGTKEHTRHSLTEEESLGG